MKYKLLILAVLALLLALSGPACGQGINLPTASDRFAWAPPARPAANVLSNVTLGGQAVWMTVKSLRSDHRSRNLWRQACSFGVAQGLTLAGKGVFHRLRPDGSDDNSFWSGHTASTASQGWQLTAATGYFRIGAGKHDWRDVLTGALVGFGAQALCNAVIN